MSRGAGHAFEDFIVTQARYRGWLAHHVRPARTKDGWRTPIAGDKGFPDLTLVRERVLYRELKVGSGRTTREQRAWIDALTSAGADVAIWTPADLESGRILAELDDRSRPLVR